MILIVTNRNDLAADFMIAKLEERDAEYFRLDSDDINSFSINVQIADGHHSAILATPYRELNLTKVKSVWYRRAIDAPADIGIADEFRHFARQEQKHLVEGLFPETESALWINPIGATERAERKLRQLALARKLGLPIPDTLVSTDPRVIRDFLESHDRVICKPLSQGLISTRSGWNAVHTWEVRKPSPDEIAGFPTLLQQLIPKGRDLRLTIVGDDHFCVSIATPPDSNIDWRAIPEEVEYDVFDLPAGVIAACRRMLDALGLIYGAFDFVLDPVGDVYFLEVNPAGEWAWLEVRLGLPMRESFIRLLLRQ